MFFPFLHSHNMYMNQLAQNPSNPWIWQPTMSSHDHHYFQIHQQQQQGTYIKEPMFEKPLTPSDVGKLNRLVIPKQHAEKYFPLDSESGEKGLLLSFEDELGKQWKFRYSYWTSSQSYVLTKGWSRFVKDKKLDAGDVVIFLRFRGYGRDERLYIDSRRRGSIEANSCAVARPNAENPWGSYASPHYYMNSVNSGEQASSSTKGSSRRLRLFGVNLECGPDPAEPEHLGSGSWN